MSCAIVGASAGVGRALATRFAAAGHDLVLVATDERDLRATAADVGIRYGVRARCIATDAGGDAQCGDRIAAAGADLGGLDAVLFPIGAVSADDRVGMDADRAARIVAVNLGAVVAIASRLLPDLAARPRASIVGFGSVAAARGRGRNVAYAAAKRALASFFESLRHACAGTRVVAQFYVLGYMDTAMADDIRGPIPKGDPHALAARVLRDLHRDVGVAYYPRFWRPVCAGIRHAPWPLFRRLKV